MNYGLFYDKNGNLSSKRIFGFCLLCLGLAWGFAGSLAGNVLMVDFAKWTLGSGTLPIIAGVAERKT
jgi:Mn2+/Fe2+ NRAMP family transporter